MKEEQSQSCAELLYSNKQAEKPAKSKLILEQKTQRLLELWTSPLQGLEKCKSGFTGFTFLLLPLFRGHKSLSAVKELQAFGFTENKTKRHDTFGLLDGTLFCSNETRNKTGVRTFYKNGTFDSSETPQTRCFLEPFSSPASRSPAEHGAGRRIVLLHRTALGNIDSCKLQSSYCRSQVTRTGFTSPCLIHSAASAPMSGAAQCPAPALPSSITAKSQASRNDPSLWNLLLPDSEIAETQRGLCNLPSFQSFFTQVIYLNCI